MAVHLAPNRNRPAPDWLRGRWNHQRRVTADRVSRAVAHLRAQDRPVTFAAIRDTINTLDGVTISTNTIQRNDLAYAVYRQYAAPRRAGWRGHRSLAALLDRTPPAERTALRSTVARLRRRSKDALIASLIELTREVKQQAHREHTLRDELLQIRLTAAPEGAQR